jgi:hypothetical protein
MSGSSASSPAGHEMTAEEHSRMSGNMPSPPAGGQDTDPGESPGTPEHGTHDGGAPATDRPRVAVLGGFGALNAAILIGAGVARRRGGGNRRRRAAAARSRAPSTTR